MKKMIYLASFGLLTTVLMVSCTKKDEVSPQNTAKQAILGKWGAVYSAKDKNKNGVLDESEKQFYSGTIYSDTAEFKSDGTFTEIIKNGSNTSTFTYSYEVNPDGKSVTIKSGVDAGTLVIEILNETEFKFKTQETPTSWSDYQKVK